MADYFFDTSVLVAYFAAEDIRSQELVQQVVDGSRRAAISALTVAELWATTLMEQAAQKQERLALISLFDVINIDQATAERGGELRRLHGMHLPDALVAACAERAGGEFMSKDSHFERLLKAGVLRGQVYEG